MQAPFAYISQICEENGLVVQDVQIDTEGKEYSASSFSLSNFKIRFRIGKNTPKKDGQFVTLWKREASGVIQPYNELDEVDYFMIWVEKNEKRGLFLFSKKVLVQKGVFSSKKALGKLGIRIYPAWCSLLNSQAKKTQKWQKEHFLNLSNDSKEDFIKLKRHFLAL